ncbi:phage regulatory CII family protein [Zhongshania sp.]|uniref:phage regulatory CII family protein n=1 Tax=Zhongshania sp. TaxID=1971902 RepID=UPI001B4C6947|nr:phage regulatory CII family protein [Zhongshania sp.]MBQ0796242.1 hypothetical protein [Zhongshania sp.]
MSDEVLKACCSHAQHTQFVSVKEIAARMGIENKWVLYKWLKDSRLPLSKIIEFERACGCALVTEHLAEQHGCVLTALPNLLPIKPIDVLLLHGEVNQGLTRLIQALRNEPEEAGSQEVIDGLNRSIKLLVQVRANLMSGGSYDAN